jgi:hypothetical protein
MGLLYLLLAIYVAVSLIIFCWCLDAAKERNWPYCYVTLFDIVFGILCAAFWPVILFKKDKVGEE